MKFELSDWHSTAYFIDYNTTTTLPFYPRVCVCVCVCVCVYAVFLSLFSLKVMCCSLMIKTVLFDWMFTTDKWAKRKQNLSKTDGGCSSSFVFFAGDFHKIFRN